MQSITFKYWGEQMKDPFYPPLILGSVAKCRFFYRTCLLVWLISSSWICSQCCIFRSAFASLLPCKYFVVLNPSHTGDVSVLCLHLFYEVEDMRFLCCSCSMRVDKNQIFEEMEKSRLKISCPLMASFLLDEMKDLWVGTSEWCNHVSTRKFNCISGLHLSILIKIVFWEELMYFLLLISSTSVSFICLQKISQK